MAIRGRRRSASGDRGGGDRAHAVETDAPGCSARTRRTELAGAPGHWSGAAITAGSAAARLAPFPGSDGGPEPGDSCLAKVGPAFLPVNTALWITMWKTWGESGVSLWKPARLAVKFEIAGPLALRRTSHDAVHCLWMNITGTLRPGTGCDWPGIAPRVARNRGHRHQAAAIV